MDSCVNQQSCYVIRPDQGGGAELCGSLASGTFSYLLVIVERECFCEKKWHKMKSEMRKVSFFNFYMVSSCYILFTGFRSVFVFALRPFLPMSVLLVTNFKFYIVITM